MEQHTFISDHAHPVHVDTNVTSAPSKSANASGPVSVLDAKTLKRLDDYRAPRRTYQDLFDDQD